MTINHLRFRLREGFLHLAYQYKKQATRQVFWRVANSMKCSPAQDFKGWPRTTRDFADCSCQLHRDSSRDISRGVCLSCSNVGAVTKPRVDSGGCATGAGSEACEVRG